MLKLFLADILREFLAFIDFYDIMCHITKKKKETDMV